MIKAEGNICVLERFGGRTYLYTKDRGWETFVILKNALGRGQKQWNDEQYLSRIIFCEMLKGSNLDDTQGFGISSFVGDNLLPIFVVDTLNNRVLMEDGRALNTCPIIGFSWTFNDFLNLESDPRVPYLKQLLKVK